MVKSNSRILNQMKSKVKIQIHTYIIWKKSILYLIKLLYLMKSNCFTTITLKVLFKTKRKYKHILHSTIIKQKYGEMEFYVVLHCGG